MKVIVDNKIPFIKEAIEKKQGKKKWFTHRGKTLPPPW